MLRKRKFATMLVYLTLELGALFGVPVRLDQIEEMARLINQTRAAVVSVREQDGEPPPDQDGEPPPDGDG